MPPISRQRHSEGSPRSISENLSNLYIGRRRHPMPPVQQKSMGLIEEGYYPDEHDEIEPSSSLHVPKLRPRSRQYVRQPRQRPSPEGQYNMDTDPWEYTGYEEPQDTGYGSDPFRNAQPAMEQYGGSGYMDKPDIEVWSPDDIYSSFIEDAEQNSSSPVFSEDLNRNWSDTAPHYSESMGYDDWQPDQDHYDDVIRSSPLYAEYDNEMLDVPDTGFLPEKRREILFFDSERPNGVPMDYIPADPLYEDARPRASPVRLPASTERSAYSTRVRSSRFRDMALDKRFRHAARAAHVKLFEQTLNGSRELADFVTELGTEIDVVNRGLNALEMLLNHEVFSSLADVYSFLHVAYAMSQTETRTPCRSTPAEFQSGLGALRNCLDNTPKRSHEDGRRIYRDTELFDEIVDAMFDEIDAAMGWLGKQEGLDILDALKRAAKKLQKTRRRLKRQHSRSPVEIDDNYDDYGGSRTEGSKWKDIVTGSIFGIVVGFMRAAGNECGMLLPRFSTAAYAFLMDPLAHTSSDLLQFFADFFGNLYNAEEPIISDTCDPTIFGAAVDMLRDGTISTLRGFENYLLFLGKMSSRSRDQFLNFTETILRRSCECANFVSERGGAGKGGLTPKWDKEYDLDYVPYRFNLAAEKYPASLHANEYSSSQSSSPEKSGSPSGSGIVCSLDGCGRVFSTRPNLYRHQRVAHAELVSGQGTEYICGYNGCNKVLRRKDNVHKHRRVVHGVTEKLRVLRV